MKQKLLDTANVHLTALLDLQKRVRRYAGTQVQAGGLLASAQEVASNWFDSVRPGLQSANFFPSLVGDLSEVFERLLRVSKTKPRKTVLLGAIDDCVTPYKSGLIHQLEIGDFSTPAGLSIAPYIDGLTSDEGEYLSEAQRCLTVNGIRACIVLGWCATVARVHAKIAEISFDRFSQATVEMNAKTTGRFKPFKKKFDISSLSELQTVFDTDILWVLEFMQLIDGNQHQRLRHCFELRNNSAHPGLAPIKGENLYAFYSDISEIVLKNQKFGLKV